MPGGSVHKVPEENPPCPTLYVRNLSEKVRKEELRKSLWQMFNQYGEIVDIYCRPRAIACKGQAWICFKDTAMATAAKGAMHGFSFYDQDISIAFARQRSDVTEKMEGTYIPGMRRTKKRKAPADGGRAEGERASKRARPAEPAAAQGQANKILFVEGCPEDRADVETLLAGYFKNFPGYKEVRSVPGNRGIAFVEFEDEQLSSQALMGLQGTNVGGSALKISFAR